MHISLETGITNVNPDKLEVDIASQDDIQVEIQPEIGFSDKFKLYINHNGRTIIRICKLRASDIMIDPRTGYMFVAGGKK